MCDMCNMCKMCSTPPNSDSVLEGISKLTDWTQTSFISIVNPHTSLGGIPS